GYASATGVGDALSSPEKVLQQKPPGYASPDLDQQVYGLWRLYWQYLTKLLDVLMHCERRNAMMLAVRVSSRRSFNGLTGIFFVL
ncbi:7145_t:CDS:2, partial [Funneliformis mosseae]